MALAGAGSTSGALLGSGSDGNGIEGDRGDRCWVPLFRGGCGEEASFVPGFDAIADVERTLRGR